MYFSQSWQINKFWGVFIVLFYCAIFLMGCGGTGSSGDDPVGDGNNSDTVQTEPSDSTSNPNTSTENPDVSTENPDASTTFQPYSLETLVEEGLIENNSKNGSANPEGTTDRYYLCSDYRNQGGNWGEIGYPWCDPTELANHPFYGDSLIGLEEQVKLDYPGLIIPRSSSTWSEGLRKPVISKLVALTTVVLESIITEKNLTYSEEERNALKDGIFAKQIHESRLSHYKIFEDENDKVRFMRGDSGHGHGLSQVDDRYHFVQLFQYAVSWDLIHNMVYGMDFYIIAWEKVKSLAVAGKLSCVTELEGTDDYYLQLARSSYSLYNSGLGSSKYCRWSDPSDTYFQNDVNYETILTGSCGNCLSQLKTDVGLPTFSDAQSQVSDIDIPSIIDTR